MMQPIDLLTAWLFTYALHSTMLLSVAYALDRIMKHRFALCEQVWKAAAFGGLVTAALQVGVVTWQPAATPIVGHWQISNEVDVQPAVEMPTPAATAETNPTTTLDSAPAQPIDWIPIIFTIWLFGVGVSGVRVVLRARALRAYLGERRKVDNATLLNAAGDFCQRAGVRRRVTLQTCARRVSPLVLGRNRVIIPQSLLFELSDAQRQSVIAHEVAHIARRDPEWLAGFALLEVLCFLQPLNALARRRVQECAEYQCDAHAARLMASPIPLAKTLVHVATWLNERKPLPQPAMAGHRNLLEDRVDRLLAARVEPASRWAPVALFIMLAGFAVVAPAITNAVQLPVIQQDDELRIPTFEFRGEIGDGRALVRAWERWRRERAEQLATYVIAHSGTVRLEFEARKGVCGTGVESDGTRMFALQPHSGWLPAGRSDRLALYVRDTKGLKRDDVGVDGSWTTPCQSAPVRVDLEVDARAITTLEITVGDPAPQPIGRLRRAFVAAPVAGAYLLEVARTHATLGERALLAAVMADVGVNEDELHGLIATAGVPQSVKAAASKWLEAGADSGEDHKKPTVQDDDDDLRIVRDMDRPLNERTAALARATRAGIGPATIIANYDNVPDRAMRVELINWLSRHPDSQVVDKLNAIVRDAVVYEEHEAALKALAVIRESTQAKPARPAGGTIAAEAVLRIVLDARQPAETRKKALVWAGNNGVDRALVRSIVDQIESAEVKQFTLDWLAKQRR